MLGFGGKQSQDKVFWEESWISEIPLGLDFKDLTPFQIISSLSIKVIIQKKKKKKKKKSNCMGDGRMEGFYLKGKVGTQAEA